MIRNHLLWLLTAFLFSIMLLAGLSAGFFPQSLNMIFFRIVRYTGLSGVFLSLILWFPAWKLRRIASAAGGFNLPLYYAVMILWFPIGAFFVWWLLGDKGRIKAGR